MSKYNLGIMSSVWSIEAPNVDVATVALRLWGQYPTIPIANYSTDEQSKFGNLLGATKDTEHIFASFVQDNKELIRTAIKTIKEQL